MAGHMRMEKPQKYLISKAWTHLLRDELDYVKIFSITAKDPDTVEKSRPGPGAGVKSGKALRKKNLQLLGKSMPGKKQWIAREKVASRLDQKEQL